MADVRGNLQRQTVNKSLSVEEKSEREVRRRQRTSETSRGKGRNENVSVVIITDFSGKYTSPN